MPEIDPEQLAIQTLVKLRDAYEGMALIYRDDLSWASGVAALDDAIDMLKFEFERRDAGEEVAT